MTDKMPDEIYGNIDFMSNGMFHCFEDSAFSDDVKYISEQKHAEGIAALKAEHRAEMAGLCDEIYGMKGVPDEPTELASSSQISAYNEACDDCIELIKQRISDE